MGRPFRPVRGGSRAGPGGEEAGGAQAVANGSQAVVFGACFGLRALTGEGRGRICRPYRTAGVGYPIHRAGCHALLRLSKLADYAVVLLARLGQEDGLHTAPALATATGIAEPTVAKVLRILSQACLVEAQRGARGGHRLAKPISAIPLSDVIIAMDGPIALTACVDGATGGCEAEGHCPVRGRWDPVNEAVRAALSAVTIADLARPSCSELHRHAPVFPPATGAAVKAVPVAAE